MIKKLFFSIILITSDVPTLKERAGYVIKSILAWGPVAILLNSIGVWFDDNMNFFSFIIYALFSNVVIGAWFHIKNKTFNWSSFFIKNIKMWVILIAVYPLLEGVSVLAGDNTAGQAFKAIMQISTLFYPASKVFKNVYILSNKKFPPSYIMEKIYNFEKTGNIKDLMDNSGK